MGIPGASPSGSFGGDVHIRTDIGVPVLMMITETDEASGGYYQARQPDTRFIRLWDVAGASHADSYIVPAQELKSLAALRSTRHQVISFLKLPSPPSIPGWSPVRRPRRRLV